MGSDPQSYLAYQHAQDMREGRREMLDEIIALVESQNDSLKLSDFLLVLKEKKRREAL